MMPRSIHPGVLLISCFLTCSVYAQEVMLPEGTPVRLRIMRTLSSATANEGDKVDFQTLDDISASDTLVVPKGSTAIATITNAEPKKRMARGGKLSINIDYVRLPNSEKLMLRGVQNLKGGGHTGAMTGGMVVTAIVVWPAAPFFLFMHGKDVSIPEGQEATVYTSSDYKVKRLPAVVSTLTAKAPTKLVGATLTNSDVFKLKEVGLSDELIVQRIQMSRGDYMLDPDDISALKKAGFSDAVISAMMTAATRP